MSAKHPLKIQHGRSDVIYTPYSFVLQLGFSSPGCSFVKTAVMMIGEFDFDDTFNSGGTIPRVTWFLFIVFLIVMTLVLMNLLVINLIIERF